MGRATDICDAILADLISVGAGLSLPAGYRTQLYAPPLSLTPERCPMLGVYVVRYPRTIIATQATYLWEYLLEVAWFEGGVSYGETAGGTDSDLPKRMLDTIEAIGDRLQSYSVGIPGVATPPPELPAYGTVEAGETTLNQSMVWKAVYEIVVSGTARGV